MYRIEGRVQGVWFRESTRRQAEARGITGYARNMPDGTVEVLACGEDGSLAELVAWLEDGPRLAQVEKVSEQDWEGEAPAGFSTS